MGVWCPPLAKQTFTEGTSGLGSTWLLPGALPGIPVSGASLLREDISRLLCEEEMASNWPGRLGESLCFSQISNLLFSSPPLPDPHSGLWRLLRLDGSASLPLKPGAVRAHLFPTACMSGQDGKSSGRATRHRPFWIRKEHGKVAKYGPCCSEKDLCHKLFRANLRAPLSSPTQHSRLWQMLGQV